MSFSWVKVLYLGAISPLTPNTRGSSLEKLTNFPRATPSARMFDNLKSMAETKQITQLLGEWKQGNASAGEQLVPLLYPELKKIAASYMRSERPGHTLQPTALIHEAYMRLVDQKSTWASRSHFYGVAAQVMRRILVDHSRKKGTTKRGGGVQKVGEEFAADVAAMSKNPNLVLLDVALTQLEKLDTRQAKVVELRYFGGLSIEETAEAMDLSPATVKREWTMARTWLKKELLKYEA